MPIEDSPARTTRFDYHPAIRYPLLFALGPLLIIAAVEAGFSKGWKVDGPIIAGATFWYSLILMVVL